MNHFRLFLIAGFIFLPITTGASTLTYLFTVDITTGPFTGQSYEGLFSLSDSLSAPDDSDTISSDSLLLGLQFSWDGTFYETSNANSAALDFEADGSYDLFSFGNNCVAGSCSYDFSESHWTVSIDFVPATGTFQYTQPGIPAIFFGTVTSTPVVVPLPSAALLLLSALGLILSHRVFK